MPELDWHAGRGDLQGLAQLDHTPEGGDIDLRAVRLYRQARLRAEMARRGVDAVILGDPVNIRYATGTRNMQVFAMRNGPARYLLPTAERAILFEFTGCEHLARGFETVDEVRPGMTLCVESCIGEEGGAEGVKLEQQVLITETGVEPLSRFPFEEELLA